MGGTVTRTRLGFIAGLTLFVSVLATLAWGLWQIGLWITSSNQLPMHSLIIQGEHEYLSREQVREAVLALPQVDNFFTLEVDQVQQQLLTLPWVSQVSVRKQWPDKLRVYIVEQDVAAFWNEGALLNRQGDIFEADYRGLELALVSLSGPDEESGKVLTEYYGLQQLLQPYGYDITHVHLTPRLSWELALSNGVRLILGREHIETRLQRFIDVYPGILERERIDYLDLRYDTGLAVGWKRDEETDNDKKRGTQSNRRA
ncbi:cell division protein FtsQ/DivIB [Zobellella maritima]|uniref:cell division protein FtsQ/DivIB n=1 Tax=Zobellella maritima TaxID=2059725 RepID=UPI000E30225B|nr:cell division protein FtsQ/DivIB [Zobellella maritima]